VQHIASACRALVVRIFMLSYKEYRGRPILAPASAA